MRTKTKTAESFFSIRINCPDESTANDVLALLGIADSRNIDGLLIWEVSSLAYEQLGFLQYATDLLRKHQKTLKNIGVKRGDISYWVLCAYIDQCNMEYNHNLLQLLVKNHLPLNISCWKK